MKDWLKQNFSNDIVLYIWLARELKWATKFLNLSLCQTAMLNASLPF